MQKGRVIEYQKKEGFGLIENRDKTIRVYKSGLYDKIKENDFVSYYIERGLQGEYAVSVKKIEE